MGDEAGNTASDQVTRILGALQAGEPGSSAELLPLVYDDLQDRDTERRGTPAVWVKFGADVALCTGALLLSAAYGALSTLTHGSRIGPMVAHTHLRTSLLIHGQTADLELYDHEGDPGETRNLASREPALTRQMLIELEERLGQGP